MGDPVPTIPEHDATGAVAAVYADIKATLGVPVVNLIWRHLATIDGGLAWAWGAAKPLYAMGAASVAVARLTERLTPPAFAPLAPGSLAAVGVPAGDIPVIQAMIAGYNRGNGLNLVALTALVSPVGAPAPAGAPPPAPTPGPALPPILSEGDVTPETWALIEALNRLGARPDEPIMASLWRHLGHWPGLLALTHAALAPRELDGSLRHAIDLTRGFARAEAAGLATLLADAGPAPEAARAAVADFTTHVITRMVPVGLAMTEWLADD
ncbi:MAG: hypothetical protein HQ481_12405 [Alphaproteobacteria bacterium]|nr:hypothetical protein [Alphaproteobacteria bacterium]